MKKNTNKKARKRNRGFSLVELIIVIAIMAILAGVLVPQFVKYIGKSRVSSDLQNAQMITDAVSAQISQDATSGTTTTGCTLPTAFASVSNVSALVGGTPAVKHGSGNAFFYEISSDGTVTVYVGPSASTAKTDTSVYELAPVVATGSDWAK